MSAILLGIFFLFFAVLPVLAVESKPPIRDKNFQGVYAGQSVADPIFIEPGAYREVTVRIKNTGKTAWEASGKNFVSAYTVDPNYHKSKFYGSGWIGSDQPAKIMKRTAPGETAEIKIILHAPKLTGNYSEKFYLAAENKTWIEGTKFFLKVQVKKAVKGDLFPKGSWGADEEDIVENIVETVSAESAPIMEEQARELLAEPTIRVLIFNPKKQAEFKSVFDYNVWSGENFMGVLPAAELATLSYAKGEYIFKSASLEFSSEDDIRLVPNDMKNYFALPDYTRIVSWKGGKNTNYNTYRGLLRFVYSESKKKIYVINELPLDSYVAGIAEVSNAAAPEYIKALAVAARSYAFFHLNNSTASDKNLFDARATTADQIYLGYNSELLIPNAVAAAEATFGEMVTFEGTPVVTPYFGNSDGKTRGWKDAWGGQNKPWLVSVVCKYDKGLKRFGHGVGMSARDAAQRAGKDGWDYKKILMYYYSGTRVEREY